MTHVDRHLRGAVINPAIDRSRDAEPFLGNAIVRSFTRHYGGAETWNWAGNATASGGQSQSLALNRLNAVCHYFNSDSRVDLLAINVTVAGTAGNVHRFGVYSDHPMADYPYRLMWSSPEIDTVANTGVISYPASLNLPGRRKYWFVAISSGGTAATLRAMTTGPCANVHAGDLLMSNNASDYIYFDQTYTGQLPCFFPQGGHGTQSAGAQFTHLVCFRST